MSMENIEKKVTGNDSNKEGEIASPEEFYLKLRELPLSEEQKRDLFELYGKKYSYVYEDS